MSVADSADYEHWPEDATVRSATSVVSGYNTANGLREYNYEPANEDKDNDAPKQKKKVDVITISPKATQSQPAQYAYQFPPPPQFQPQYMPGYPPLMQYACYPSALQQYPMAVPAPAYYGLPPPPQPGMAYGLPPGYVCNPVPAAIASPKSESNGGKKGDKEKKTRDDKSEGKKDDKQKYKKKAKKAEPLKWQGRTEAEVEEDNMKIAVTEGAYDARKVVPVGLEDDQIVWIILPDGTQSVRTWAEAKTMPGEWLEDPRFKNGWFLLCPQEKKEDREDDKSEKSGSKKGKKKGENEKEKEDGVGGKKAEEEKKGCTCGGK